jgi:hypothetical protein
VLTVEFLTPGAFPCSWMLNNWTRFILLCALPEELPDSMATNETMRMIGYMQADGEFRQSILKWKQALREVNHNEKATHS